MSFRTKGLHIAGLSSAVAFVLLLGCGGGGGYGTNPSPPPPADCTPTGSTVCMTTSNTFNPTQVTITHGGSVTWSNTTGTTHNVTFSTAGAPASVPDFASGTRSVTFPNAGTFAYNCTIHGLSMSGTVVVQLPMRSRRASAARATQVDAPCWQLAARGYRARAHPRSLHPMRIQHLAFLVSVVVATTMCGGSGGDTTTGPGGSNNSAGGTTYGDPGVTPATCTPGNGVVCLTTSNTFSPTSITITKGSAVVWNNTTGTTHNVTFSTAGAPANVADFASGTRSVTFPNAGTFAYNCTIHGISMSGTVVVQ